MPTRLPSCHRPQDTDALDLTDVYAPPCKHAMSAANLTTHHRVSEHAVFLPNLASHLVAANQGD